MYLVNACGSQCARRHVKRSINLVNQNKLWSRSLRERRRRKRISKADVATDSKLEIANDLDIKRRGGKYGKRAEKMEKFSHSLMESTSRKIKKTLKLQYIFIYTLYISIYN